MPTPQSSVPSLPAPRSPLAARRSPSLYSSAPIPARVRPLSLHSPTRLSGRQRLYLLHAHPIEIPRDRVLEARRGGGELERFDVVAIGEQTVNQPCRERVAGAYPI